MSFIKIATSLWHSFSPKCAALLAQKKFYTTIYHPQCNEQIGRVNGKVISALRIIWFITHVNALYLRPCSLIRTVRKFTALKLSHSLTSSCCDHHRTWNRRISRTLRTRIPQYISGLSGLVALKSTWILQNSRFTSQKFGTISTLTINSNSLNRR